MSKDRTAFEQSIGKEKMLIDEFIGEIEKVVLGQRYLIERILLALVANGHILIEGLPGLAKTLTVKIFSEVVRLNFSRIQFTPDMLPADLTGAPIYDQKTGTFQIKRGPIFTNILLADEINRAPSKVQSALLEVMQEKQVTILERTYKIDEPFLVLATQNAIEQDGTYPLPESQLDRFMLKVNITYPERQDEARILRRMSYTSVNLDVQQIFNPDHIQYLRGLVDQVHVDEKIENYILDIVAATRKPQLFELDDLRPLIQYGVSPRATLHLTIAAKAYALIQGRSYVRPQDVKSLGVDILGHRLIESYQARAQKMTSAMILQRILDGIVMP
ncbi:MAG: MoxR family ATPase [Candidatus Omnitrophica bacterium]|nr:MoxR family ATPase [Candidatus Omnitrophota bacterium]